mmetsp:Transcript_7931/g.11316  ORF Transcript_7931/g.11316 Transcript_7931/m.11316 type:complete len:449 (+) Transcript_7931:1-1347(+)
MNFIFGYSSSYWSSQMQMMKAAEEELVRFASRYDGIGVNIKNKDSDYHKLEVFDTFIPRSVIPLKKGVKCQVYREDNIQKNKGDQISSNKQEDDYLIMHGIKATSNLIQRDERSAPLVLLHGYANGALYFYRNLLGLAHHHFGGEVYALDMLGWGLSSRPSLNVKVKPGKDEVDATEDFFVESLEAWRKANNIKKMILGGHSMGGYFSVAYCEKYPEHVERLILISPAGVPDETDMYSLFGNDLSWKQNALFHTAAFLWKIGLTPSSVIRSLSESRGKSMVTNYVEGRLPEVTRFDERLHLSEYLYRNAVLPGSGEQCLNKVLKPFARSKKPTVYRVPKLKVDNVSFIYGQYDWMDVSAGVKVQRICETMPKEGKHVPNINVYTVRNAGHLLMLENWEEFNSAVILAGGGAGKLSHNAPKPKLCHPDEVRETSYERMRRRFRKTQEVQ